MMMLAVIKILIIGGLGLTILANIPDLMIPLSNMIDTVFNANLSSVMNTVYSTIPERLMTIITLQAGTLAIYIIITWFIGGKKSK